MTDTNKSPRLRTVDKVKPPYQLNQFPADLNIIQRIKGAWNVLLGKEHVMSEIWIHRADVKDFVEFVADFALNPITASGVPTLRACDTATPSQAGGSGLS